MSLIPTWPIAVGALVIGLATGATGAKLWYADTVADTVADLKVEIADMKSDTAKSEADDARIALADYKAAAEVVTAAALGAQTDLTTINAQLAAIRKGQKNAPPPPLPADCKPGPVRLRNLAETAAAADATIARPVPRK